MPVSKLEQWASGIRTDTALRKQFSTAIATRAKALAVDDPGLVDRGLERWTRQLATRQRAREEVAVRTLAHLAEDELPTDARAPTDDFMGIFEEIAEKTSSAALADLVSRILAGEIRHPGSISRRTLQLVAVLDGEIVSALRILLPYISDQGFLLVPPSKIPEWRMPLALLSDLSIINEPGPRSLEWNDEGMTALAYGGQAIILTRKVNRMDLKRFVEGANLTPSGSALISVFPKTHESPIEEIAAGFYEDRFLVSRIQIGSARPDQSGVDEATLRDFRVPGVE